MARASKDSKGVQTKADGRAGLTAGLWHKARELGAHELHAQVGVWSTVAFETPSIRFEGSRLLGSGP